MQLVYLIGIFEDNHNNVRHHFETDSVNLINNRLLGTKKKRRKFQCISTWFSHISKSWELFLGTTAVKAFVIHADLRQTVEKLDDLEKNWANVTSNL